MCGVVGILYREGRTGPVGSDLIKMLQGLQHRGPDSTGVAIFGPPEPSSFILRIRLGDARPGETQLLMERAKELGAQVLEANEEGGFLRLKVSLKSRPDEFLRSLEGFDGVTIFSFGRTLEVIKDLGTADDIDQKYHVSSFKGSHGIGHVRLATESRVDITRSHPFWAFGFPDLAIVHNGQLTNYHKLKRDLLKKGYLFRTDNDSELIALFLSHQLLQGASLDVALQEALKQLDGTYSFLVATRDQIGYAKDKLGAKPMIIVERDDVVALATEEVALSRVLGDGALSTFEPYPSTFKTWST